MIKALVFQWMATGFVGIVSFAIVIILGRTMGPEQFGVYNFYLSLVSIYMILMDGGFKTLIFREGTKLSVGYDFSHKEVLSLAVGNVSLFLTIGLVVTLFVSGSAGNILFFALIFAAFSSVTMFVSSQLKAEGKFVAESIWQSTTRAVTFSTILLAVIIGWHEISDIFLAWSIGLGICLLLPYARPFWTWPNMRIHPDILKMSIFIIIIEATTVIYFRADIIMLTLLGVAPGEVGNYSAAYRVLEGVILVMTPVAHMGFRQLRLNWQSPLQLQRVLAGLLGAMVIISIIIIITGYNLSENVIRAAFGRNYEGASEILYVLLLAIIFILPNYILTQSALALNLEKKYAISACITALMNVVLNLMFIPEFGVLAAVWTTIATEFFLLICLLFILRHVVYSKDMSELG